MQFKNPEILYALFLLLIPILVHLFQLRRFKKTPFSNVAFLQAVSQNTRKSSVIKKWLILFTRLLALSALILAFAHPFLPATETATRERETVIFLDNSFSMQAKSSRENLLTEAIQDLVSHYPPNKKFTLLTNNAVYRDISVETNRNELLDIAFSPAAANYDNLSLRISSQFSKDPSTLKQAILISDFQQFEITEVPEYDQMQQQLVRLRPLSSENISIDSVALNRGATDYSLQVFLFSTSKISAAKPLSLHDSGKLIAKTAVTFKESDTASTVFRLPADRQILGKLSIQDSGLAFDNDFFFSINNPGPLNILAVNSADANFLERLYRPQEFNYTAVAESSLDYSNVSDKNLIILNELKSIPDGLVSVLKEHTNKGGKIILIPSMQEENTTYNALLKEYRFLPFGEKIDEQKRITTINYDHPVYQDVFTRRATNLSYHQVSSYFPLNASRLLLAYENGSPFLAESNGLFVFTAALSEENSNFKNGQLIVPTFDQIAVQALSLPDIYYTLGSQTRFDIPAPPEGDAVIVLEKEGRQIIPLQEKQGGKITLFTEEGLENAGIYAVGFKQDTLSQVAYNYDRRESRLSESQLNGASDQTVQSSVAAVIKQLEEDTNLNLLYKWFVIFAVVGLLLEMLILKFYK